jgi:hypothetical protein
MLTDSEIIEFQEIWKKNFGEEISKDEAYEKGSGVVELMRVICGPDIAEKVI